MERREGTKLIIDALSLEDWKYLWRNMIGNWCSYEHIIVTLNCELQKLHKIPQEVGLLVLEIFKQLSDGT